VERKTKLSDMVLSEHWTKKDPAFFDCEDFYVENFPSSVEPNLARKLAQEFPSIKGCNKNFPPQLQNLARIFAIVAT
jgi:hypothetical protein